MKQHIIASYISLKNSSLDNDIISEIIKNLSMREEIFEKYQRNVMFAHNDLIYVLIYILGWYKSNNNWNNIYHDENNFAKWLLVKERSFMHPVAIAMRQPEKLKWINELL